MVHVLRVVLVAWLLTACGSLVGWLLGHVIGRPEICGVVVGTLAILLALRVLAEAGWFNAERRRGGSIGGLCGFALAAPLATMNVDAPLVAFAVMLLVGVGVIAGAGPSAAIGSRQA
jgi:hypothetical protein